MRGSRLVIAGVTALIVGLPVAGAMSPPGRVPALIAQTPGQGAELRMVTALDRAPLDLRGFFDPRDDAVVLHETAGAEVTVRITPVAADGTAVDGGRVIVLRPNETRTVHLARVLPIGDVLGHHLLLETLRGDGQAEVDVSWLAPAEIAATAAATTAGAVHHHLDGDAPPTSDDLIVQAEALGTLDHETAVLYHVYSLFGDARLPTAYRGDEANVFESMYLSTVAAEWGSYSPATQAVLKPFLLPPAYGGSWLTPTVTAGSGSLAAVRAFDMPPNCDNTVIFSPWEYAENANGKVRVWYDSSADDSAVAALLATTADTKIWPAYASFMAGHEPLPDGSTSCNGGSARLDVYLTDIPRSFTQGHIGCSNTPAYVIMTRSAGVTTLAHEIFHAFQFSFEVGGCLTDDAYRWLTEGSATWAEQYLYPNDWGALQQARHIVRFPERPLDSTLANIERVYGTFLVPFYVQNQYFPSDPQFVGQAWLKCKTQDAIHAVDAAIPGGFAKIWHEIALRDWNYPRVDDYTKWRPLLRQFHASPQQNWIVDAAAQPDYEFNQLKMDLGHLTATYKTFEFQGPEISSVAFFNGATFNLSKIPAPPFGPYWDEQPAPADKIQGVKVQAIVEIEGQAPTVEDWTNKPYVTFCRDTIAERLQRLTIVISNARLDDSGGHATPPGMAPVLWVSNMGCWKWTGSARYQATGQVAGSQIDNTTDVVWTRTSATHRPPEVTYQATGHIVVTLGNRCSGGGTVAITPSASSLATYNFTPADAAGRRGYSGYSFEFSTVPAVCDGMAGVAITGLWFNIVPPAPPNPPVFKFSADGKHMVGDFTDPKTQGLAWHWDLTAQRQ